MFNPVFLLPIQYGTGVARAESGDSAQISSQLAGRKTERDREGLSVSLLPNPEKLTKEKEECRG